MTDIPHFAVPFRVTGGKIATVKQDSDDDVLTCVETVLRTPLGFRTENPEFGIDDLAFATPEAMELEAERAISEWEPRAGSVAETEIRNLIATVQIGVSNG